MGLLLILVLANFRGGQHSGELDIALKQTVNGIEYVRTMTLGGQITDDLFPEGGYGIHFNSNWYNSFAAFESGDVPLRTIQLNNAEFFSFCGSNEIEIVDPPCQASWQAVDNFLEIIFSSPDQIIYKPDGGEDFKYIGGIIKHAKTGQTAYFYISLATGLVISGIL